VDMWHEGSNSTYHPVRPGEQSNWRSPLHQFQPESGIRDMSMYGRVETPSRMTTPQNSRTRDLDSVPQNDHVVQFSSAIYFASEAAPSFRVDLMRMGPLRGRSTVQYRTVDGSAKAGKRYVASEGTVCFEDNEYERSIDLQIIDDPTWAATLEFKIELYDPEDCTLGKYLHRCRVKVIDKDCFPTSKYSEQIEDHVASMSDGMEPETELGGFSLFAEFIKLLLLEKSLRKKTFLILAMDQIKNLYIALTLWMGVYMVDEVFDVKKKADVMEPLFFGLHREHTAYLFAVLTVAPMIALHGCDAWKAKMNVVGEVKFYLRTNLFRKYLNYSDESRRKWDQSSVQAAIIYDCKDMADGYAAFLAMSQLFGKFSVLVGFTLWQNPEVAPVIFVLLLIFWLFVYCRNAMLIEVTEDVGQKQIEVIDIMGDTCKNYDLISDYMQRPQVNEMFSRQADEVRHLEPPVALIMNNNKYFTKWLGPASVGLYLASSAYGTLHYNNPPLGILLATINVFNMLSSEFEALYKEIEMVNRIVGALLGLTLMFNMPTDLNAMQEQLEYNVLLGRDERLRMLSSASDSDVDAVDMMPIKVIGVSFSYVPEQPVFVNLDFKVPQGKIIAVVGVHGSGKKTLLNLLARTMFPSEGHVFLPTHLRTLHVSQSASLLRTTVWKNLIFGDPNDADPVRIRSILEKLQMWSTLDMIREDLAHLQQGMEGLAPPEASLATETSMDTSMDSEFEPEQDDSSGYWRQAASYTESVKIHLARAFIMNPEVLVLQRPLYHFARDARPMVWKLIKEYVSNKGVSMPPVSKPLRRPRTVIFTPDNLDDAKEADLILHIADKQVTQFSPSELQGHESIAQLRSDMENTKRKKSKEANARHAPHMPVSNGNGHKMGTVRSARAHLDQSRQHHHRQGHSRATLW